MIGVYKITNTINGKVYIGEALNIIGRWSKHIKDLEKGIHHSVDLQIDYYIYGIECFKFEVIQVIDSNLDDIIVKCLLYILEDKYIKQYNSIKDGYNSQDTLDVILRKNAKFNNDLEMNIFKNIINIFNNNNNTYNSILIQNIKTQLKDELIKYKEENLYEETKLNKVEDNNSKIKNTLIDLYNKNNIDIIINKCKEYKFPEEFIKLCDLLRYNGFSQNKVYQILRDIKILDKNNLSLINDGTMFRIEEKLYINKETNIEKHYRLTYISQKGFKYILRKILDYAQNNNIIVFTNKFIKENLLVD